MNRPEKVTKFLNHMFPTEDDKLIFEAIYTHNSYVQDNNNCRKHKYELAMPSNAYYIKLKCLYPTAHYYTDANTAAEIHDALCTYKNTTIKHYSATIFYKLRT